MAFEILFFKNNELLVGKAHIFTLAFDMALLCRICMAAMLLKLISRKLYGKVYFW